MPLVEGRRPPLLVITRTNEVDEERLAVVHENGNPLPVVCGLLRRECHRDVDLGVRSTLAIGSTEPEPRVLLRHDLEENGHPREVVDVEGPG